MAAAAAVVAVLVVPVVLLPLVIVCAARVLVVAAVVGEAAAVAMLLGRCCFFLSAPEMSPITDLSADVRVSCIVCALDVKCVDAVQLAPLRKDFGACCSRVFCCAGGFSPTQLIAYGACTIWPNARPCYPG